MESARLDDITEVSCRMDRVRSRWRSSDDYDVVVMGLANMFDQYSDRVVVAELDSNEALIDTRRHSAAW